MTQGAGGFGKSDQVFEFVVVDDGRNLSVSESRPDFISQIRFQAQRLGQNGFIPGLEASKPPNGSEGRTGQGIDRRLVPTVNNDKQKSQRLRDGCLFLVGLNLQ